MKEKHPDLPEVKKKAVFEETKAHYFNVSGEDRRIVGTERIQTEAGSFDCFVLEETITTKAMMMKDVEKIIDFNNNSE